jgi:hypothetical protein
MSQATVRRIAILEPVSIFAMIMAYIWALRYVHHGFWLAILALMLISHAARHERAASLGFRFANLRECLRQFGPALLFFALLMVALGLLFRTTRPIGFDRAVLSWAAYLPWGLFQQYILNGYFMTRFDALVSRRSAPLIAAALFSGAHTPNWFLMAVTLLLGYCCARVYRRYKNLYFLAIAHATIGFLLFLVVPDSISHHLNVGPGWFR